MKLSKSSTRSLRWYVLAPDAIGMTSTFALGAFRSRAALVVALALVLGVVGSPGEARAGIKYGQMVEYELTFPVDGNHYFRDTFGARRSHGKGHQGQDVFAKKGTPVVAAASGTVRYVNWTSRSHLNPSRCCSVVIGHEDGWQSRYLHLDNDRPGTDDGKGWGIAPGIVPGARVEAGQLIGWVGDSGNAEETGPHLHFELLDPGRVHANPFEALILAGGNPPPVSIGAVDLQLGGDGLLRRGDRGDDVRRLQEVLAGLGYDLGDADGIFGPRTAAAVREFQADLGIGVDGLVGPETLGRLTDSSSEESSVVGLGSRGETVREAQRLLEALGFSPGPVDGVFGPRTLGAVLEYQRSQGLTVDGLAGPQTLNQLGVR